MKLPPTRTLLVPLLILDLILWLVLVNVGESPATYMGEGKPMTWISAVHLGLCASLAAILYARRSKQMGGCRGQSCLIWLLIAVGFVFLLVDELTQFHENLDKWIHAGLGWEQTPLSSRLDDFIIMGYGLVALTLIRHYWGEFRAVHGWIPFLVASFIAFFLMVALDLVSSRADLIALILPDESDHTPVMKWLNAIEEAMKVLAEALFAATFFHCLRQVPRLGSTASQSSE